MHKFFVIKMLLCCACILPQTELLGQEKVREIGPRLTNLSSFGVIYKRETARKNYLRIRLLAGDVAFRSVGDNQSGQFSIGAAIGLEKRRKLAEKIQFVHGFEPSLDVSLNTTFDATSVLLQAGIGYVIGMQYDLSESLYISLETIPSLSFSGTATSRNQQTYQVRAGFNSNVAALTVAYRFRS